MKDRKGSKGVTLLELVVAVAILGIVAAIGFPNLQTSLERNRQKEAAYELASVLRLARAKALELGNRTAIRLSVGGETELDADGENEDYILFVDSDSSSNFTAGEVVISDNRWGRGADIDASSVSNVVVYKPSGLLLAGTNTTVTIGNYQVTVQPTTGRVIVQ